MTEEGDNSGVDDYVLVPLSGYDSERFITPGEKPEVTAKIKVWLSPTEFDSEISEYRKHLSAHVEGTSEWILATDQYKRWYETGEIGDLWIRGIPGSGKSVVAASLIQRLQRKGDAPVLFFFFRHIIMSNRSPQSLMRDCLYQLLDHSPSLQSNLKNVMVGHPNVDGVPMDELWKCFSSALSGMDKVYCVIDALDEMELGEEKFLADLLDLGRRNPTSVKLALTSRQLPYLEVHLKGSCLVDLRLDRRNVDKDIAIYISHRLEHSQVDLTNQEALDLKEAICERGKGLFLYARLMMDQCLQDPQHFTSQLDMLPDGLGNMYTSLLREHATRSGTTEEFQKLILQWVTHSLRPLRLLELAAIVNSSPNRGGLQQDQDAKIAVRSACGPLLEICEDEVVQIIHHSFTEFLLNSDVSHIQMATKDSLRFPAISPTEAHKSITLACLSYLKSGCFDDWDARKKLRDDDKYKAMREKTLRFQFLQYAARYWPLHAAKMADLDLELVNEFDVFLRVDNHDFESWKDFWNGMSTNVPELLSPLHVAAYSGLASYTEHLLAGGADPNTRDSRQTTPLIYSAMEGHSSTATALLEYGAHYDCVDSSGLNAVHYSAKMNHAAVLGVLLAAGAEALIPKADQDSNTTHYSIHTVRNNQVEVPPETALFYVCENGHVEALVELMKYVDSATLSRGTLHWAAAMGRAKILNVLLKNDQVRSHINDKDGNGNTALYLAANARDPAAVRVLLERGADVNARSEHLSVNRRFQVTEPRVSVPKLGYTPLHGWARLGGPHYSQRAEDGMGDVKEVLELLLKFGCDINAQDEKGQTVLFAWPAFRDFRTDRAETFISLLLKNGADASLTAADGDTPLHMSFPDKKARNILRILVDAGTNINAARKSDGKTPLIAAAEQRLMGPSIFDGFDVDFDHQDSEGNTALHYACSSWGMEYHNAEEWLTRADPTILNNAGRAALTNFAWGNGGQGRIDAIALMVKKGLSLESRDYLGRTPLLHFLSKETSGGSERFVRELLRLGADATAKDHEGKSALHLLATCHLSNIDHGKRDLAIKLDLMRDLIKARANPREVDYYGNTIFHDAIGNDDIPKYSLCSFNAIIAVGGELNKKNFQGRTALHISASSETIGPRDPENPVACSLDYLLQPHLKFDVNALDHNGVSPLHIATKYTTAGINVWKLIQSGAKIEARTIQHETPLHYAARAGNCNNLDIIVDLYLARSLSLDFQNLKGATALHLAAQSGRLESVKILLHAGADPCIRDVRGRNALHFAAEFGEISEARRALRAYDEKDPLKKERPIFCHPCDKKPDAFDKMNIVISSENATQRVREVVRLLLAAGVDPSQLDENEHTPSDVAIMLGSVAVVDELATVMNGPYSASDTSAISSRLRPLDPLGESLMSSTSRNFQKCLEIVDFQSDTIRTLERAICYGNELIVEEIMRIKQPRLVEADGSSALHLVARWGLVSVMEKLIPYVRDLQNISPPLLHAALERSLPNTDMVKLLIKHGVDVNFLHHVTKKSPRTQGNEGRKTSTAALHILAAGHHWWYAKALRELLNAGADLEMKSHLGETALQIAISARGQSFWCDHMLDVLLEYGANVNIVASKTNLTPLNSALEAKRGPSIVKKLLNYGADGTVGPKPAIASAIDSLDYQSLEILFKAGADPNIVYKSTDLKRYDKETGFETPLQNAACAPQTHYGDVDDESFGPWLEKRGSVMTLLITHGANPYQPLKEGKSTVFHEICAINGLVRAIIEAGTDLEMKDCEGRTPLLRSCDLTHRNRAITGEHASLELINGGANVHAMDNNGSTALHYAIKSALGRTTKILIDRGVSPTAKDKAGFSPLYYALNPSDYCTLMHSGRKAIVALLDAGADPLEESPDGRTALHCLAPYLMKLGSIDGKDLLNEYRRPDDPDYFAEFSKLYTRFVDAGCDREARDKNGNTPLFEYVAAEKQYSEVETPNPPDPKDMRKMFAEHDIHAVNNEGDTLLHVAARREEDYMCEGDTLELFKLLVELGLDPTRENYGRVSALDIAAAYGNEKILALYARNE